ncbi:pentapeptide repeat-containing protein [Haloterrigena salifodinae]|uniref:Pentapeptide repeat-containing protein n=1 Tax=Haloterrigena salifodinae TaxID=2675099 RepID=A0A8T8E369_9EURY|nr:pentapeptide repeat-containing protein [Haloterrigena salifodinae]
MSEFIGGTIRDSDFTAAELSESDFTDCRMINCDFIDANLSGSRFLGADLDDRTEFGGQLLSEYEADKLAEPDFLHQQLDIPQISDRGFGRDTDPITETPPESQFKSIPKWPAK